MLDVLSGTLAEVIELVETGEVSFALVTTVGTVCGLTSLEESSAELGQPLLQIVAVHRRN